ncbi:MAG TPA: hypothetical protein DGK91_13820 [Clostridium sp.]|nr:hypothetical protein [Clostridia bacterium]HCW05490.1 hypothetical protein [Clostridium sp.]
MRKVLDGLSWLFVVLTTFSVISTLLYQYNFAYVTGFSRYSIMKVCIFITMLLWAFKMLKMNTGTKKWVYSSIFFLFALISFIFIFIKDVW